jgi:HTH-type transcriptional regulator/antitoxin HigA
MSAIEIQRALRACPQVKPALYMPRSEREYRQLVRLLDQLVDEIGENEAPPFASMMKILGLLIEKYEDEHVKELACGA